MLEYALTGFVEAYFDVKGRILCAGDTCRSLWKEVMER